MGTIDKRESKRAQIRQVAELIRLKKWEELKSLLAAQPSLLMPEVGAQAGRLAGQSEPEQETDDEKQYLTESERGLNKWLAARAPEEGAEEYRRLFGRCREVGIQNALAEAGKVPPAVCDDKFERIRERLENKHLFDDYIEELEDWQVRRALGDWDKLAHHAQFGDAPAPFRDQILTELGTLRTMRYHVSGRIRDLRAAAEAFRRIAESSDRKSPYLAPALVNLANCLREEFKHTGRLEDLDRAIEASREAADEISDTDSRAGVMNSLGACLAERFEMTGQVKDLNEAISALRLHRKLDPFEPSENLALALVNRARLTRNSSDLDRAVEILEEAVKWSPSAGSYANLGAALALRFEKSGRRRDLKRSLAASENAVSLSPPNSPGLGDCLANLVRGLAMLKELTGDSTRLNRALVKCQTLCRKRNAADTISAARAWAESSARKGRWRSAAEAYRIALDRIQAVYQGQGIVEHKAAWIREAQGVATEAAYTFSKLGNLEMALQCFEVGRTRLIREMLALRPGHTWARKTSATVANVSQAAGRVFLVYIAACSHGGIALAVRHHSRLRVVWLPKLDRKTLRHNLREYLAAYRRRGERPARWQKAIGAMTEWLWRAAMEPVLATLDRPAAMTLIRAGQLSILPLHAAWTEDPRQPTGRRYVIDETLVSYAASAEMLGASKRLARRAKAETLLAVSDPRPVAAPPIVCAREETRCAAGHFLNSQILRGRDARTKDVMEMLSKCDVWHFACHGRAEPEALESGLLLAHNERITIASMRGARERGMPARLAVLSACETAIESGDLPDEAVSLATAFLLAGAAGVIGTLWPVPNEPCTAALMCRFYELWRQEGLEPAEALRRAQQWLRDSTTAVGQDHLRSAKLLSKVGVRERGRRLSGGIRAHADPYYWAGFTYMGA